MPKKINVTVLVDEAHRPRLADMARKLEEHGFSVNESNDSIGVLSGTVDASSLSKLRQVDGVAAVEKDRDDYRTQS